MHEISLVASLLEIMRDEMGKYSAGTRLSSVIVRCGALSNALPEALSTAFTVMTQDTEFAGVDLEIEEDALRLACGACGEEFTPEDFPVSSLAPCPRCGEELAHRVLAGRELYVRRLTII
ncbi:MAG: hydrogenase maturation nickel metallochaperone HypA [Desulfovibrio sp.]|jgi:hydrogenase nickel incorporation protein HypA/HybF|nr:hydrogenase maturation nickel metallochaperone HypA [Desulfovibrio sp.]